MNTSNILQPCGYNAPSGMFEICGLQNPCMFTTQGDFFCYDLLTPPSPAEYRFAPAPASFLQTAPAGLPSPIQYRNPFQS